MRSLALAELADRWRSDALVLRRYGREAEADQLEARAAELVAAEQAAGDELLDLQEAAAESGYSKRRIRELVAEGAVPNAGRKGAPRIRRADLPQKPGGRQRRSQRSGDSYDAEADARDVALRVERGNP